MHHITITLILLTVIANAGPITVSPPRPDPTPAEVQAKADEMALLQITPIPFERPIETPTLILTVKSNGWGVARECIEGVGTIEYLYHQSPVEKAKVEANRFAAITNVLGKRQNAKDKVNAINGNSAEKQALQAILDRLNAIEGVRP